MRAAPVTILILADREPYSSFDYEGLFEREGDSRGSLARAFRVYCGPSELDEAEPGIIVLPAFDFISLRGSPWGRMALDWPCYLAYGPVSLMEESFARGSADYMREPWALRELRARLLRLLGLAFSAGEIILILKGSSLQAGSSSISLCPMELFLLRLLVRNAPLPITKEALGLDPNMLARSISELRVKLERLEPGLGRRLHTVRGIGYRFDVEACG